VADAVNQADQRVDPDPEARARDLERAVEQLREGAEALQLAALGRGLAGRLDPRLRRVAQATGEDLRGTAGLVDGVQRHAGILAGRDAPSSSKMCAIVGAPAGILRRATATQRRLRPTRRIPGWRLPC